MNYLPLITAVVSGLLIWQLGRFNSRREDKKQEIKRLRRLLYNMLELKHWVDKEIAAEAFLIPCMQKLEQQIAVHFPGKPAGEILEIKSKAISVLKNVILRQPQLPKLEQNITEIVREYSEIDPFFAYELTGKYQLTETLEQMKSAVSDIVTETEDIPVASLFTSQLLRPLMLKDLQQDLIMHLPRIAEMIDHETLERINKDHLAISVAVDENQMEAAIQEFFPHLLATAANFVTPEP